jgi:hypothetical protein
MASLDRNLRRDLENAVKKARRVAESGARQAVEQLAVGHHEPWSALSPDQRQLRNRLRAHGRQLGDKLDETKGTQSIDRLTGECAYEHWHRLLFARFLAENDLLVEPQSGMALSLDECRELAREQSKDWLVLASDFAQRMLPQIFRAGDPVLEVALPPEKRQELEAILEGLPREVFIADDSLGWVYQFWQADQKDAVNASENKIGADELPAVTQLFTEDYMVLFLLHNTLGAWWAGKVFAQKPEVARSAASEDECRAACAVQAIEWSYLRFVRESEAWRPAASTFPGWPTAAKNLTVLDPCMGSGHFLAFALPMLVALRREEEKLSLADAVDAVLRDNLFGLELDPRCTQIAAFNVGLTAWKLAGYRPLPAMHLASSGLAVLGRERDWIALAAGNSRAEAGMKALYELFQQAPLLGSLIDPSVLAPDLHRAGFEELAPLLEQAIAAEPEGERAELAVVARGLAAAGQILSRKFTLVTTNVPYLTQIRQDPRLRKYAEQYFSDSRNDLAMTFLSRCLRQLQPGGTHAVVLPQTLLFLVRFEALRRRLLTNCTWNLLGLLGEHAFDSPQAAGAFAVLLAVSASSLKDEDRCECAYDVSAQRGEQPIYADDKARLLRSIAPKPFVPSQQLRNPDARVLLSDVAAGVLLEGYALCRLGVVSGDGPHWIRKFWEFPAVANGWRFLQSAPDRTTEYAGLQDVIDWHASGDGMLRPGSDNAAFGRIGVAVGQMSTLPASLYTGDLYDNNVAAIVPTDISVVPALWAYCSSEDYAAAVRKLDKKVGVIHGSLLKVPFDEERWRRIADERFPKGLPAGFSNEPPQWLFHGHPCAAVSWNAAQRDVVRDTLRRDGAVLQGAVAKLLGYRWPAEAGAMRGNLAPAAQLVVAESEALLRHADDDGVVCLVPLRGEESAADRLRTLLVDAYGAQWSSAVLEDLLRGAGQASIEDWLRDSFFEEHCALFGQRPFVWQVSDGLRTGFSALVNYHRLAAPSGEGHRTLEKLIYTYLGDWLDRQRADQKAGVEGADGRVAAAKHLKRELEKILEGEPPYDIFVRWKPLHQQPVGWEPDIDDGVRVNIRPFLTAKPLNARGKNACILRVAPKIKWDKDRGKEPTREKADFPWFWGWDESAQDFVGGEDFDGNRWNDLHYSRAAKLAARERADGGKS